MKKYYIETYGCPLSHFDSNTMIYLLDSNGYRMTSNIDEAEIVIVNTCAVRLDTEAKIIKRLKEIKNYSTKSKIVISGCLVKARPSLVERTLPDASLISPQNVSKILDVVESNKKVILLNGERDNEKMFIPPSRDSTATIMIAEGCLDNCSFCITKLARRTLRSYRPRLVVDTVQELVKNGVKEIRLTGQDTAAYGLDLVPKTRLDELISMIIDRIDGDYRIRIGMMTPNRSVEIIDSLLELYRDDRVFKFFHIPVQSGDENLLKVMNRDYSVEEFKDLHRKIKAKFPSSLFATDIIVGHPGEDEESFNNTTRLVRELKFERVYLAQYSIRPRTKSASMQQVPEPIKKKRSGMLNQIIREEAEKIYRTYIGREEEVLVTSRGFKKSYVVGRMQNYFPVAIDGDEGLIGRRLLVKIEGASYFDLRSNTYRNP
ncbi:MAG: tRNA (N(6)-L-threonylcarbamoyladenosine(37)-C(2))-methylthiotransferase [Caldisphaeraceae archaeon]|nr:tRNA (N(6)-L-threonylcarbamoyladenosine(37)-C(2))-methylthiotransferase [Caldisphaeraceae archaeon]